MTLMECQNDIVFLEEKPNEEFEPSEEEAHNYAKWLGLDPDQDAHLLYLAREGLRAPLKDGWRPCQNEQGEIFYFNTLTGQSSWDHPADEEYKQKVKEQKSQKLQILGERLQAANNASGHNGQTARGLPVARIHCCRRRLP